MMSKYMRTRTNVYEDAHKKLNTCRHTSKSVNEDIHEYQIMDADTRKEKNKKDTHKDVIMHAITHL